MAKKETVLSADALSRSLEQSLVISLALTLYTDCWMKAACGTAKHRVIQVFSFWRAWAGGALVGVFVLGECCSGARVRMGGNRGALGRQGDLNEQVLF